MLTNDQRGISGIRTLSLLAGALMLVTVSCLVPGPDRDASLPMGPETEVTPDQQGAEGLTALSEAPTFTPFTVAPEITNRMELSRLLHAEYPSELRDAGIGGRVIVHVFVDADGTVGNSQISEASGHPALDEAALRVAGQMEFAPARNQEEAVPVWISLPVEFSLTDHDHAPAPARDAEVVGDQDERPRDLPAPTAALEDEPTFTPFTVAPEVLNRGELVELLQELYPAELRDAGVGGTARVHIFVDETGTVQNTEMAESSGHPALDEAAQEVAREFSFSPALNRDERVAVWIALPITFQTR